MAALRGARLPASALVQGAAWVALAGAFAVASVCAYDALQWIGRPFPGFLPHNNLLVSVFSRPEWSGTAAGLRFFDRIVAVEGTPVETGRDVLRLAATAPARPLRYRVVSPAGAVRDVAATPMRFTVGDFVICFLPLYVGGLIYLLSAALVLYLRPNSPETWAFGLFTLSLGIGSGITPFDDASTYRFIPLRIWSEALIAPSLFHLAVVFPERRRLARPPIIVPLYAVFLSFTVCYHVAYVLSVRWWIRLGPVKWALIAAGMAAFFVSTAVSYYRSDSAVVRARAGVLFWPFAASLPLVLLLTIFLPFRMRWPIWLFPLIGWVYPVGLAYAILKHNIFEASVVARRALIYTLVAVCLLIAYLVLFLLLTRIFVRAGVSVAVLAPVAFVLLLVAFIRPLQQWIQVSMERMFFPATHAFAEAVRQAADRFRTLLSATDVERHLREVATPFLQPKDVRLFLRDHEHGEFRKIGGPDGGVRAAISIHDRLLTAFAATPAYLSRYELEVKKTQDPQPLLWLERMSELGAALVLPLRFHNELRGLLLLGPRQTGAYYTREDVELLQTLANQAAVALENARAYDEITALQERLKRENIYLKEEIKEEFKVEELVGRSPAIRTVIDQVGKAAATDATVLLTGETGTGKELVARALHNLSARHDKLLVRVNCAAIPEPLLESELFGHEKGAFTGAIARHLGRFEVAVGGTIFLDEVDGLSLGMQAKLLRVLQEKEIERVGGTEPIPVDIRVVAATNQPLRELVRAGRFREDLYFRLNVVPIRVPALRERREDIPLLVSYFIEQFNTELHKSVEGIDEHSLEEMLLYGWPGNVRELRNLIERAMVMASQDTKVLNLGALLQDFLPEHPAPPTGPRATLSEQVRDFKIAMIKDALRQAGGNQRRAAELLGIHRPTLTRMIKELGIEVGK